MGTVPWAQFLLISTKGRFFSKNDYLILKVMTVKFTGNARKKKHNHFDKRAVSVSSQE